MTCKMATSYDHVLVIWFVLFVMSLSTAETSLLQEPNPKALVVAVSKDHNTSQYIITRLNHTNPFVHLKLTVDLGGPALWVDCEKYFNTPFYQPVSCSSPQCLLTDSNFCGVGFQCPIPGCNSTFCGSIVDNPFYDSHTNGAVSLDNITIASTNGFNPGKLVTVSNFIYNCALTYFLKDLAAGMKGIAGLGWTKVSLPAQFASAFNFASKFAICLSSSKGVIFFGDGPYVFRSTIDVSKSLTFIPLIRNPIPTTSGPYPPLSGQNYSSDYFIGVTDIHINDKSVEINTTLLSIDENGKGGTKISTAKPYTVMETSIYKAVVAAFGKALEKVPRVGAMAPFELCFNSSSLGSTRVGPTVPTIDLVLDQGVIWKIFGANSMVQASDEALCLGFVDGGVDPRTSIVIGGHQLEDNLLQFDLAASRLGFSSSLLFSQTTCANFNFAVSSRP